ncbi:MAG TPA: sulfotransferase [Acidimicrobiales bacterium]|nr:sulfotransferase [Acidimicrobiales bacterium]
MTPGSPIRITDLRRPELSDVQRLALDHGEHHPVELTVDAVLASATERAGLCDFGPDDFRSRLGLWLAEVDGDGGRTALGRLMLFRDCVRYAVNRLRIRDTLTRHPEIGDVEIVAPIVVVGLPRSGTTHLVNLIAADTRLRSLPLWESYEPVPDPGEAGTADGVDPRYRRAEADWQNMAAMLPSMAAMHPMRPDHIHEELELQLPDFSSYQLEWVARAPRWRDYYLEHDQTPHYAYLKSVLQILQWRSAGEPPGSDKRWVLKSPQHLEQLGPLLATFPDATVVVTHRDPVSVVQSAATMMTYAARMSYRTPEPEFYLSYWTDRIRRLLEASLRDRSLVPPARREDVFFHDFMADEPSAVARIYATAGLDMTDSARHQMGTYLTDHPRGKDGRVVYDLRADFGVTPDEVRDAFGFYHDAVAVPIEVT